MRPDSFFFVFFSKRMPSATVIRITRAQSILTGDAPGFIAEIEEAVRKVRIEMGVYPARSSPGVEPSIK